MNTTIAKTPQTLPWPHMVAIPWRSDVIYNKEFDSMEKWCLDKLSSRGVLWKIVYNRNILSTEFHFAHGHDAVLFRLANGV